MDDKPSTAPSVDPKETVFMGWERAVPMCCSDGPDVFQRSSFMSSSAVVCGLNHPREDQHPCLAAVWLETEAHARDKRGRLLGFAFISQRFQMNSENLWRISNWTDANGRWFDFKPESLSKSEPRRSSPL